MSFAFTPETSPIPMQPAVHEIFSKAIKNESDWL